MVMGGMYAVKPMGVVVIGNGFVIRVCTRAASTSNSDRMTAWSANEIARDVGSPLTESGSTVKTGRESSFGRITVAREGMLDNFD